MKYRNFIFVFLLTAFILLINSVNSQVTLEWAASYSGQANYDVTSSMAVDKYGNIYTAGFTTNTNLFEDFLIIKYNSAGQQQWVRTYDGPAGQDDYINSIALDSAGNIYITGASYGLSTNKDFATIKYNPSGAVQWVSRYNASGNSYESASKLILDKNGNIYIFGLSSPVNNNFDVLLVKYNSIGVLQWARTYAGPANRDDVINQIALDNSGNIYISGWSVNFANFADWLIIKYDTSGVQQWVVIFNGPRQAGDYSTDMDLDNNGNIYVTGWTYGYLIDRNDFCTIKYNPSGVQQWMRMYDGPDTSSNDEASEIEVDNNNNVYVSGSSEGIGSDYDYATIKYNSDGVIQWVQRFNGAGNYIDDVQSMTIDADANIYVTGRSTGIPTHINDIVTVKYTAMGSHEWTATYRAAGTVYNEPNEMIIDSSRIYITGVTSTAPTNRRALTLKYSQIIGIEQISSELPTEYILHQNFPNPFNPSTKIRFSIPVSGHIVKLEVYDVLGRKISTLIDQEMKAGTYEVDFNAENYPSGIYFCILQVVDNSNIVSTRLTGKMILIK